MPASVRHRRNHGRNQPKKDVVFGPDNYATSVDYDVSLLLYAHPDGCPYESLYFEQALEERGLLPHVDYVVQKGKPTNVFALVLKTAEDKQIVAEVPALRVKGRYCAVVDPCLKETTIKVHWVPFNVSDETLKEVFEEYGVVKEVIREKCIERGFEDTESTTRHISICLEDKYFKHRIPHLWNTGEARVNIFIPGRQPKCSRCLKMHRYHSQEKQCPTCGTSKYAC
ncbi:hypothetical protein HPB52_015310 [Rhipicephalus sanguineus]|uniref:Uncharacterized protein n=1 Tax=Rhipicephalus sanguineus TaxID=34632 RepID=A0A9D4T6A9_RHISA|nr:hypothetical protein HPB52_015310 [Rhipicephalus sanguineus]